MVTDNTDQTQELGDTVFNTLLLVASQEGANRLPSIEEALVVEIVAGTVAHLAGSNEASKVPSFEQISWRTGMQRTVNHIFKEALITSGSRLNPDLAAALRWLTHFEFHTDHGEKWYETPLGEKLEFLDRHPTRSTFALSVPFVAEAKEAYNQLPAAIKEHCQAIGIAMRPYIIRDIEHIKAQYRW